MKPTSRIRFAGAIVGLALAVAGCGGPSATAKFAARANAICAAADRQLAELTSSHKPSFGTPAALLAKEASLVAKEVPIDQAEMRRLGSLKAPAGKRAAYAAAVVQAREDVALLPKMEAALRSKSRAQLSSITEQSSALSDIAVAGMKALGLPKCARNL